MASMTFRVFWDAAPCNKVSYYGLPPGMLSFGKDSVVGLLIEIQTLPAFISNYFGGYKTTWLAAQNLY
jgi:hypothetical protein